MDPQVERRFVRSIVRQVHPDLFSAHPYERNRNAESLKVLNVYVDCLASGRPVDGSQLEFWVKEGDSLTLVEASLPPYGSLGPLFYAFGLISREELEQGFGNCDNGADSRNFLQWLQSTVAEALSTAEQHEAYKSQIRGLRADLEERFGLAAVHVGGEFAVGFAEQLRQVESLEVAHEAMAVASTALGDAAAFEGLTLRLYHPDSAPFDPSRFAEDGPADGTRAAPTLQSHVADDGCLHVVADPRTASDALQALDLEQARLLTRLSSFWTRRVRELTPAVAELLGIEHVWCDTRTEHSAQRFVLWAGYLLGSAGAMRDQLQGRRFSFSLLVHSDTAAPLVDFLSSSSVLQVRSDCPPPRLLEFLLSESGSAADRSAEEVASTREAEESALDAVRAALGAKHVIRVCSSYEQDKVLAACQRLLDNADLIRGSVDLSGASLAIDDCYELWESGFMSIPYDFRLEDLQPQLQRLLAASSSADAAHAAAKAAEAAALPPGGSGEPGSSGSSNGYANGYANGNGGSNGYGNGSSNGYDNGGSSSGGYDQPVGGYESGAVFVNGHDHHQGSGVAAIAGGSGGGPRATALHRQQQQQQQQRASLQHSQRFGGGSRGSRGLLGRSLLRRGAAPAATAAAVPPRHAAAVAVRPAGSFSSRSSALARAGVR